MKDRKVYCIFEPSDFHEIEADIKFIDENSDFRLVYDYGRIKHLTNIKRFLPEDILKGIFTSSVAIFFPTKNMTLSTQAQIGAALMAPTPIIMIQNDYLTGNCFHEDAHILNCKMVCIVPDKEILVEILKKVFENKEECFKPGTGLKEGNVDVS